MTKDAVTPDPLTEPQSEGRARLVLIDKLRGLVIVLMILDHVRDFFSRDGLLFSPTDLSKTNAALFATRWITHLCAPTFVLLAGVAVHLQRARGKRGGALARFLVTRGLWLVVLEVTWVSFAFGFSEPFVLLQVIYAIGVSFILLAPLTALPPRAVLALGLVIVCGHDLLAPIKAQALGALALPFELAFQPGRIPDGYVAYPVLPWLGIMACGYGAGALFREEPRRRDRRLVAIGVAMLAAFAVLRATNVYGDPAPWVSSAHPVLAFLNVTKYPPSLDYVLVTLGLVLTLAPAIARIGGPLGALILTFGRVPLFVYLLHLYLAHLAAVLVGTAMGVPPGAFFGAGQRERLAAAGWGFGLPGVYLAWAGIVLALWPLAAWYARLKARRRDWWLGYL